VRRAAREHAASPLGDFLSELAGEIETDRMTLREVMKSVGARPHRVKLAVAWAMEKAARLKFNGRLLRRSALSTFIELETLALGIQGKRALWAALLAADLLQRERLEELIARAEAQHAAVERHRLEAGRRALGRDA
jgi:hypothetical protein